MTAEPYASADRVFWIAGNGSCHRGAASIQRLTRAWSNAHQSTCPRTPPGWTRQKSTSRSSSARSSTPTTSRSQPDPRPPGRVRNPLERHRQTIRLDLHPHQPRSTAAPHRRPRKDSVPAL